MDSKRHSYTLGCETEEAVNYRLTNISFGIAQQVTEQRDCQLNVRVEWRWDSKSGCFFSALSRMSIHLVLRDLTGISYCRLTNVERGLQTQCLAGTPLPNDIIPTNIHLIDAPPFTLATPPLGALPPPEPFEEPDPPPDPPAPAALAATVKMGMALPVNEA
ncbi:hypothetical protein B0H13DRAFT_1872729 [Mycena leptocephala]|nr:hypothetical protein B0H13DRAFT_1872729 [Mycena leptocephala]